MTHAMLAQIRVRETNEETLRTHVAKNTKRCSGCDPDVPNHVPQAACKRCKGSGREKLSYLAIFTELSAPNKRSNDDSDDFE
jgi:hypothetical protein